MAQRLYEERTGAAGIRMPGQVHVPTMPVDTRGASLLGAVADAGEKIGGLLAREYAREQQTRIGERLLAARKEFAAWQEQYVQTRQGGNALTAGEDFAAKMREIADRQLAAFGGKSNEVFQRELSGQMAALTLRAQEQGAAYASGQRSLWERSVLEGQRAQLLADAERDPGNGAWLDFQLMEYGRSLAARGLDATAPMMELGSAVQLRRGLAYVQRGDLGAASGLLQGWKPGGEHPGDLSARYESGADGSSAIGYDRQGGTSYGRFQLSSKKGGMDGFLRFLEGRGGEAASMAARLRAAGPADTGGKSGAMPEAWKKEAQAPGFADLEREYIQRAFYEPVMRSLPSGAAAAVKASPQLGQMVWSTAVQHGATGAAGILRKVWRDGMTPEDFVRAAYTERASRFGGSEPDVRASVQRRLRREADDLLGGLSGRGGINGMSLADAARLDGAIEEAAGTALAQGIVTRLLALPEEEREAETCRMLDDIPDREARLKAAVLVERELAFQARRQKAADADAARRLAAGARGMPPIERARYFAQSGASRTVRNLATELLNNGAETDAVALSRAREDISNGMSVEEVSGIYGPLINERDMEGLRALSVDEERKKAGRKLSAFFEDMAAQSGLNRENARDAAYLGAVRAEFEEKWANGDFSSPREQKNWLYEKLARRRTKGLLRGKDEVSPHAAVGDADARMPVPAWEVEAIRRQLVRDYGISDPTEEQIQAIYNGRDAR